MYKTNTMDLKEFALSFYGECLFKLEKKNKDYTADSEDELSNFKAVEVLGVDPAHGFLTRMMDKLKRASTFVHKKEYNVDDESVKDTLQDLANYGLLLHYYFEQEKKKIEELKIQNNLKL